MIKMVVLVLVLVVLVMLVMNHILVDLEDRGDLEDGGVTLFLSQ